MVGQLAITANLRMGNRDVVTYQRVMADANAIQLRVIADDSLMANSALAG